MPSQSPAPKPPPGPWAMQANCLGLDPTLFFPEVGQNWDARQALAVCRACAVTADCLAYAMQNPVEVSGVWGGTVPKQRRVTGRTAGRRPQAVR